MLNRVRGWTLALALVLTAAGCSESDEPANRPEDSVFPALEETTTGAGEEMQVAFTARSAWMLGSDRSWCRFVEGDFVEGTLRGTAGEQHVTIRITDAGQNYTDDDVAQITLSMGGRTETICRITRPHKTLPTFTVRTSDGAPVDADHPLLIRGGRITSEVTTSVSLEFEAEGVLFGVPEEGLAPWLKVTASGNGFAFAFDTHNSAGFDQKYPIGEEQKATVTFAVARNGEELARLTVPVRYEGLAGDVLALDRTYLNVTADPTGTSLTGQSGISGTETTEYGSELLATVTTRNDDFEIVEFVPATLNQWGEVESDYDFSDGGDLDWVLTERVAGTKDGLRVTVEPLPDHVETREAMVMVFPREVYEEIKGDLAGGILDEDGEIKSAYTPYMLADIAQEQTGGTSDGITFVPYVCMDMGFGPTVMSMEEVAANLGGSYPTFEKLDSSDPYYEMLSEMTTNIWRITFNPTGDENHFMIMSGSETRLAIEAAGMNESMMFAPMEIPNGLSGEFIPSAEDMTGQTKTNLYTLWYSNGMPSPNEIVLMVMDGSGTFHGICIVTLN